MRLTYSPEVEAFRAEFSAWLDANLPDEAATAIRPRSSADIPAWSRSLQRRMCDDGWRVCTGSLAHEREMLWILWSQGLDRMLDDMIEQLNDGAGAGAASDPVVLDGLGSSIMDSWTLRLLGQRHLARSRRGLHVATSRC